MSTLPLVKSEPVSGPEAPGTAVPCSCTSPWLDSVALDTSCTVRLPTKVSCEAATESVPVPAVGAG